jgi:CheY-like chemotaxis protein/two-component sensor histidine kinase
LAAIGELSAGVGHEINNPLTIALGLIGKAKRLLDKENFSREQLLEVLRKQDDACRRIKTIVDGLRTFSRKENESENPCSDLKEAISSTLSLVSAMYLEQKIAIDSNFPEGECFISCDIAPTQQIIMNTLYNARDAVLGLSNAKISVMVSSHEKFWRATISDNGYGIPEKIASKVFDSFFSTKPAGHGTGLGLSLSKTLLDKCGGRISFESRVNEGTTFYLDFPKILDLGNSKEIQAASKIFTESLLSVLIVDDEAGILEILADLLGQHGFDVTCSKNALTAIELIRLQQFNLILTDMNMPEMDGIRFLTELATQNLATNSSKYLMSGGSSIDSLVNDEGARIKLVDGFIHKPFSNDEVKSMTEKVWARVTREVAY